MSAIANLVASAGSGVVITQLPISVSREKGMLMAEWRENASGVPVEAQTRTFLSIQRLKSGIWKTEIRVEVPVQETVTNQNAAGYTAAPKVAFVETAQYIGYHHPRSLQAHRKFGRGLLANLLNGVTTTVTATDSGPAYDAIDLLVGPT